MSQDNPKFELTSKIMEKLAEIEHERWSHWQLHMHNIAKRLSDGSIIIPAEYVQKWDSQARTNYAELTEEEKESDREQVRRYAPMILRIISEESN